MDVAGGEGRSRTRRRRRSSRRELSDARARSVSGRGLLATLLVLLVLMLGIDLARPDSAIRALWPDGEDRTRGEMLVDEAARQGLIPPRRR